MGEIPLQLESAVRFTAEVAEGGDAERLVGRVKTLTQVAELGGEHASASVVLGDNAYEVVEGFLASPDTAQEACTKRTNPFPVCGTLMAARSYPIQLQLAGRKVLVAGAGRVATRKIERLVQCGASVHVVAREASGIVQRLAREQKLQLSLRSVEAADVNGMFLVIAATNSTEANTS